MVSPQGDTIIAITIPQLIKVNQTINKFKKLEEVNILLNTEIDYLNETVVNLNKSLKAQQTISGLYKSQQEYSEGYISYLIEVEKQKKRKYNKNLFMVGTVGVSVGIILGLLIN